MLGKKQFSQRKLSHSISARLSLKLLNSSENGFCFNSLDKSFKRNWTAQFFKKVS